MAAVGHAAAGDGRWSAASRIAVPGDPLDGAAYFVVSLGLFCFGFLGFFAFLSITVSSPIVL